MSHNNPNELGHNLKHCNKCDCDKEVSEFHRDGHKKDGLSTICKECSKANARNWVLNNWDKRQEYLERYYEENKEYIKSKSRKWRDDNLEYKRQWDREYSALHSEYLAEQARLRYWENREDHLNKCKQYREENKEYLSQKSKEYQQNNKEKLAEHRREYEKERRKNDPNFRLKGILQSWIQRSVQDKKSSRTIEILQYSPKDLKKRIEFQFEPGMTWDNYGEWEIDHRIPMSYFFSKGEDRPHIINALSNLQPLWKEENRKKGSNLEMELKNVS